MAKINLLTTFALAGILSCNGSKPAPLDLRGPVAVSYYGENSGELEGLLDRLEGSRVSYNLQKLDQTPNPASGNPFGAGYLLSPNSRGIEYRSAIHVGLGEESRLSDVEGLYHVNGPLNTFTYWNGNLIPTEHDCTNEYCD